MPISSLDIRAFSPTELKDGWRLACRAVATTDLAVEVPPMVTRPKAATVGVGRQVILRPSLQKRYLEMEEPTLEDQASDLERVLREIDDLDVTRLARRAARPRHDAPDVRLQGHRGDLGRRADRRRARRHDRVAARHGLRPRHHDGRRHAARPQHRHAGRRRLDAEHAAAVRRRRDHAHLGHDARSRRARAPARSRAGDARAARARGLREGRHRAGGRVRGRARRQRHDDAARARHGSRAARRRAVHHDDALVRDAAAPPTSGSRCIRARPPTSSPRSAPTSAATSSPASSRRA